MTYYDWRGFVNEELDYYWNQVKQSLFEIAKIDMDSVRIVVRYIRYRVTDNGNEQETFEYVFNKYTVFRLSISRLAETTKCENNSFNDR